MNEDGQAIVNENVKEGEGSMIEESQLLTRYRVTDEHVDAVIEKTEYYLLPDSQLTVCCLTLMNGFNVVGTSACVDPANFDAVVGREIAYNNAKAKIFQLEGYLLKEQMYQARFAAPSGIGAAPSPQAY